MVLDQVRHVGAMVWRILKSEPDLVILCMGIRIVKVPEGWLIFNGARQVQAARGEINCLDGIALLQGLASAISPLACFGCVLSIAVVHGHLCLQQWLSDGGVVKAYAMLPTQYQKFVAIDDGIPHQAIGDGGKQAAMRGEQVEHIAVLVGKEGANLLLQMGIFGG